LGVVFFAHGAQKVLGWFGGGGYARSMSFFTHNLGLPEILAFAAIMAEFLGGIGLILGFLSRIAGAAIAIEMAVAIAMVHLPNGFFMNWFGNQKGEGFEYHLLAIAIAITIAIRGAGALSVDRALESQRPFHSHRHPYATPLHG
jgi:putative oxidoreductase